ncbi:ras-related protein Rab-13-like isoform X2 [Liolophura sinensis]
MWREKKDYDISYKVVLLGETFVGKTALLNYLQGEPLDKQPMPTIGFDFITHTFDVEGAKVRLELWDTAGQERFRSLTRSYYKESHGAVLVYDVTDVQSLAAVQFWCDCIRLELGYDASSTATLPVVLLGNKADLQTQRKVSTNRGEEEAAMQQVMEFFETSAVTGDNVYLAFKILAKHLTETLHPKLLKMLPKVEEEVEPSWTETSFKLEPEETPTEERKCPCTS